MNQKEQLKYDIEQKLLNKNLNIKQLLSEIIKISENLDDSNYEKIAPY